jgi:hypothetical protein
MSDKHQQPGYYDNPMRKPKPVSTSTWGRHFGKVILLGSFGTFVTLKSVLARYDTIWLFVSFSTKHVCILFYRNIVKLFKPNILLFKSQFLSNFWTFLNEKHKNLWPKFSNLKPKNQVSTVLEKNWHHFNHKFINFLIRHSMTWYLRYNFQKFCILS